MKQSRGHGIHSPFAYDLITNVLRSPYSYYAFQDIERVLTDSGLDAGVISGFNHLSYRLVHHFNAKTILEINSGKGVNTLFLTAPSRDTRCTCVEEDVGAVAIAKRLQEKLGMRSEIIPVLPAGEEKCYDAIFVNLDDKNQITIDTLMEHSHDNSFWVFYPLNCSSGKQYWHNIVKDERARITFDTRNCGIVFLRFSQHKLNYFV
ncbi:MAG: hypothetical protein GX042_10540 [Bacteroidales bacterium]|jgi:hypothetical protein|nr:hypothetical protein [Bacteroidales bacterium]